MWCHCIENTCNNKHIISYITRLSLNKMSTVIGWFLVTCPWPNSNVSRSGYNCTVVARTPCLFRFAIWLFKGKSKNKYNKTLNVWSLSKLVSFVFARVLMFPQMTSGLSGKQNELFPSGPYIKCILTKIQISRLPRARPFQLTEEGRNIAWLWPCIFPSALWCGRMLKTQKPFIRGSSNSDTICTLASVSCILEALSRAIKVPSLSPHSPQGSVRWFKPLFKLLTATLCAPSSRSPWRAASTHFRRDGDTAVGLVQLKVFQPAKEWSTTYQAFFNTQRTQSTELYQICIEKETNRDKDLIFKCCINLYHLLLSLQLL